MPHFSFKTGIPIAKISGGKYDKKIVCIVEDDNNYQKGDEELSFKNQVLEKYLNSHIKGNGRKKNDKVNAMIYAIKHNERPEEPELADLYDDMQLNMKKKDNKEIVIKDEGQLTPIPKLNGREIVYASAPSGAGKTTWIAKYAHNFKKMFPDAEVFLFSRLDEDPSIDYVKPQRIMLDEELLEEPIMPEELGHGSLVIFDDTDTLRHKGLLNEINELKDDLLQTGRHQNIYVVISSHMMTNYKQTRILLSECNKMVVYPQSGSAYQINYCLKNYFGLSKQDIQKIRRLPSRWVCVNKQYPMVVMHERGCYFVNPT